MVGIWKLNVCTDTVVFCELHGNPSLHASALDYNDFLIKGRGKGEGDSICKFFSKFFESIAGVKP
jgi:hypothetical protein